MKAAGLIFAAALAALVAPAMAQPGSALADARRSGIVGERYDGYLGLAKAAPEDVRRQVGAVNIQRRSLYTGLATRRNVTLPAVGLAAGCELLKKVGAGESYMLQDGAWRRRSPGDPPPVPGYCAK